MSISPAIWKASPRLAGTSERSRRGSSWLNVVGAVVQQTPPPVVPFLLDTFTDVDGTPLPSHTGETGATWEVQAGASPSSPDAIIGGGLWSPTSVGVYQASGNPASPNYYVEATLKWLTSISTDSVGVGARMQTGVASYYWARWNGTVNGWQLFKTVNASSTQMGTTVPGTFTSGSKVLRLTVNGSTISLSVDGVQLLSVTDTSITTAGKAGVRMGATQTANTGIHIDSITAVAI